MPVPISMNTRILDDIRKLLGPDTASYFDTDLLIHINTYLADLTQVGVGPPTGMFVNENTTWMQFIGDQHYTLLPQIRTYVYLRVKQVFDPSQSGFTTTALKEAANELLWRINVDAEIEVPDE